MRDFLAGWHMYYIERRALLIVILGGSDKSTQSTDIATAISLSSLLKIKPVQDIKLADCRPFDFAEYLADEWVITEYMNSMLEENDPVIQASALGDVVRGMSQLAKETGLSR